MTTEIISPADPEVKDFTKRMQVKFKIDDDVFIGVPNLTVDGLIEFVNFTKEISEADLENQPKFFRVIADLVLTESSAELFKKRLSDKDNPISIGQAMEIVPWVMEQYGLRPTEPSSDSSNSQQEPDDGTKSTENVSVEESISEPTPVIAS